LPKGRFVKNGFAEAQKDHAIPDAIAAVAKPADEPNAAAAAPCGTCVACKSCPFSSQSVGGAAGPTAKPDTEAPPPLNQGAKKS